MAESPASSTSKSVSKEPESPGGFRSFWRKSDKQAGPQNVQFVPQNPSSKQKPNKLSRLLKHGRSASAGDDHSRGPGEASVASKRRQQVYQAQKRHRNRKEEYVQSLEAEIARLQHMDALINSEKNNLAHQNEAIKSLLATHSIESHMDVMTFNSSSASEDLSMLGSAGIDIRYDPVIDHERVFMDIGEVAETDGTFSDAYQPGGQPKRVARGCAVKGDSWAALDFILALEWPCRDHVHHHGINPEASGSGASDVQEVHGHALTATKAVYQSTFPPPDSSREKAGHLDRPIQTQNGLHPGTLNKWQLPHSEIDKLVAFSEQLQLNDEQVTPAQAYSTIRQEVPSEAFLVPVLEALKVPLGSLVQCSGFGAYMTAEMFYRHFDGALQSVKARQSEFAEKLVES